MWWLEDFYDRYSYHSVKKQRAISEGKHVMNKNESKVMRKLQNETGMTQEEIRGIKKYRVMLSEAQDEGEKRKHGFGINSILKTILKSCTKELKLAKEHPKVVELFKKKVEERIKSGGRRAFQLHSFPYADFPFQKQK